MRHLITLPFLAVVCLLGALRAEDLPPTITIAAGSVRHLPMLAASRLLLIVPSPAVAGC